MQNVSSFTLSNSGNGPAVNQEDHDDDHECDPAVEDCTTDSDGDGTPDWDDDCEDHAGPPENYGCPEGMTPYSGPDDGYDDPDGDGIVGEWDECPNTHGGPNEVRGCPDSDADGVADYEDSCPGEMEDWMGPLDGCPTANDSDGDGVPDDQDNCPNTGNQDQADFNGDGSGDVCSDADGDGYYDSFDQCPSEPAVASGDGCPPVDSDGDGVPDDIDQCPNEPGNVNGCPAPTDSDGDGIPDSSDSCPNEYGNVNGCPAPTDSDGDGIPDSSDSCPNEYGTQSNGCPEIQNMPPMIISPTSITTNADTPVQFTIIASDPDGPQDQVSFNPQIQPQHGTLSFVPGTQVGNQHDYIYSPYSGYSGPDSFGIMVWDGLVNSEITTITITVIPVDETPTDSDGDGIPDSSDSCPNEYGTQSNGCPLDSDGDGIPDSSDSCPFDPENDADNDGYCVPEDLCPYEYTSDSTYSIGGCPDTPPPADSDGDGITDDVDSCPSQAENYNNYQDTDGCPDTLPEGNIPPEIIVPTSITTNMNTPVTFRAIITEPDGPQKEPSIYHWIEEKHGTFDVKQLGGLDREYTYTPHKDYVGTDTFTLRVWDGKVNTDAPVTITIKAVDYSFDQDGDGINDDTDQCKSEPENFNQYLDDDGCPDSIPTVTNVSEITVDKIPDFHEYFNYIVSGYLKSPNGLPIDRAELVVSLINTDTGSEVYGHNYGKPQKVTTIGDGSWITWVGGKSFVGNHKLVITFEGNSFYDKSEVSFPVEVKPLGGLPGCVQYDQYTYFKKVPSGEVLCDDFHGTVRLKDNKITSPGTVQYGDEFQAIGYNFRFVVLPVRDGIFLESTN